MLCFFYLQINVFNIYGSKYISAYQVRLSIMTVNVYIKFYNRSSKGN